MSTHKLKYFTTSTLVGFALLAVVPTSFLIAKSQPSTVAFSESSPIYKRKLLPTGRYEPETYAFGEGQCMDKSGKDDSLNHLAFREMATILAEALQGADYVPTPGPEQTQLLIVVHWGRTSPFDGGLNDLAVDAMAEAMNGFNQLDTSNAENAALNSSMASYYEGQIEQMLMLQQMAEEQRNRGNAYNAHLLGYQNELKRTAELGELYFPMRNYRADLMDELETPRYFVILQAYDFQKLMKEKKREMLWTTRFSIRAKGRKFDEEIRNMAMAASRVIGSDSKRLKRSLKPARVEFGELEYLGVEKE